MASAHSGVEQSKGEGAEGGVLSNVLPIIHGEAGVRGRGGGARHYAWWPRRQFNEHVASSDVGKVGAKLGQLRADLNLGPKSKVVAHLMIYKTH